MVIKLELLNLWGQACVNFMCTCKFNTIGKVCDRPLQLGNRKQVKQYPYKIAIICLSPLFMPIVFLSSDRYSQRNSWRMT